MRENRLTTSKGISLPNLKNLFLVGQCRCHCCMLAFSLQAANMLTKLEDLENLIRLTTLHLRDNKIETLDGFSENMKQLQYVNLRYVEETDAEKMIRSHLCF